MSGSVPPVGDGTDGPSTTRDERVARLRGLLSSGARADTRWARRLRVNRSSNILIETALHAAARLSEGLPLSDLEQQLVDQMAEIVTVEEVGEYGKLYKDAASGVAEFFPAGVARLPLERSYSLADYAADQEVLVRDILAQPNVNIIDVASLPQGVPADGPDGPASPESEEFVAAMGEYGSALTVVTAPALDAVVLAPSTFTLKGHKFLLVRESDEVGSEEYYWATGAGSDEAAHREYRSPVFKDLDAGEYRGFGDGGILFQGRVDRFCFLDIEAWEEDSGGIWEQISKYLYKVSNGAMEAAERGQASGNPDDNAQAAAGALALFGVVTEFVGWLFSLFENKDDFVLHRAFGFTRAALVALSKVPGGVGWPAGLASYEFNGGREGHLRLWIHTAYQRASEPGPRHYALSMSNAGRVYGQPYAGNADQSFQRVPQADGSTGIRNPRHNLALSMNSAGVVTGRPYAGDADQSFKLVPQADGSTGIRNPYHNLALSVSGTGVLTGRTYTGGTDQSFEIVPQDGDDSTGIRSTYHAAP
ncbi:RICIN domain-containing protein [Streptomyces qinzhouensis]|uniref:RICIN domain-containing protein n=1 Tax=Streptomyces qinzhouensis TaxID=2599401 RepID=A0A5B8IBZ1_9ACTN|nr:RICIN domain-containing protein [Streptomyces qinzhouensis]QDY75658.1 RICIN domain-containing protein [Streptomyces qinzhouensis]